MTNSPEEQAVGTGATPPQQPGLLAGAIGTRRALLYAVAAVSIGDFLGDGGSYFTGSGAGNASLWGAVAGFVLVLQLSRIITRWARKHVVSGSLMSYISIEVGPRAGFFTGAALLVGYAAVVSIYTVNVIFFGLSFLNSLGIPYPSDTVAIVGAAVLIAAMVGLVRRGVNVSVNAAIILGYLLVPVAVLAIGAALLQDGVHLGPLLTMEGASLTALVSGLVMMFGFFAGFEGITALAKETKNPKRTTPMVLNVLVGTMAVALILSIILTVPIMMNNADALAAGESPFHVLAEVGHLSWLGPLGDGLVTLSLLGSAIAYLTDASRVTAAAAAADRRLLPAVVGRVSRKHHTPTAAIVAIGLIVLAMVVAATFTSPDGFWGAGVVYTQVTALAWLLAYIVTAAAGAGAAKRAGKTGSLIASSLTFIVLVGLEVYQLMNATSTFLSVFSWLAMAAVAAIWVQALIRHKPTETRDGSLGSQPSERAAVEPRGRTSSNSSGS